MAATKDDVVAFLKQCSGGELADVMRRVLPTREEAEPEGRAYQYRMFLGMAVRENVAERPGAEAWGPWGLATVGYLDERRYPADFAGVPFCQWGTCGACGVRVCGHVKAAICPVCGHAVALT
jgi:hypothetical protein